MNYGDAYLGFDWGVNLVQSLIDKNPKEFSEAASKPIKHNPEGESNTKKRIEFAKGKFNTTAIERVLNKLKK